MSTHYLYKRKGKQVEGLPTECNVSLFHYCPNCNVALVGEWTYYDLSIGYDADIPQLEKELKGKKSISTDSLQSLYIWKRYLKEYRRWRSLLPISEFVLDGKIYTDKEIEGFCYEYSIKEGKERHKLCKEYVPSIHDKIKKCYSNISDDIRTFREEITIFKETKKCPLCGGDFCNNPEIFHSLYDDDTISMGKKIRTIEKQIVKKFADKAEHKVKKFESLDKRRLSGQKKTINDVEMLKEYLHHIISLEKTLFSVSKRLNVLYSELPIVYSDAFVQGRLPLLSSNNELLKLQKRRIELEAKKVEETIKKEMVELIPLPLKPEEPQKPTLLTPGFFNKKKVLLQNEQILASYNLQITQYQEEHKQYLQQVEEVNKQNQVLLDEQEKEYHVKIEKARQKNLQEICEIDVSISAIKNEIDIINREGKKVAAPQVALIEKEISEAEELLKNTYNALNEMYGCGIIFEKYRDFVSVSTFYEYISSGRCYTLEGPQGAYNLYESEIRADILISQMSQVLTSLEKIKNNQYAIYSAINEANVQLQSLNSSMNRAVKSLTSIENDTSNMSSKLEEIAENSSVIAYNTEATAFYAKKNAELTNALGYMVALS